MAVPPGSGEETSTSNGDGDSVVRCDYRSADDELVYTGTGIILALATDAADNIVFTMDDALAESGGVYVLPRVVATKTGEIGAPRPQRSPVGADGDVAVAVPVAIATGLGPFLPGVAVCPRTGDVYVARGHTGLTRVRKTGGFETKVGK